jgi:hypothetical protein
VSEVRSMRERQVANSFRQVKSVSVDRDSSAAIVIRIQAFGFAPVILDNVRAELYDETHPNATVRGTLSMIAKEFARGPVYEYRFVPENASAANAIAFVGLNHWSRVTHVVFHLPEGAHYASNDFDIRRCHHIRL